MAANSKIAWTMHTFNPWEGCQKVSPGCDNCYAEARSKRWGYSDVGKKGFRLWGPPATTKRLARSETYWRQPETWNREAEGVAERPRVFCASLADVFEDNPDPVVIAGRFRLWDLIASTPNLDWLLLTKRPQNIRAMLPEAWRANMPKNIWLGTTVEDQQRADERISELLANPATVRFLSVEPQVGPVDLWRWLSPRRRLVVDWVIVGGESGSKARPFDVAWARSIVGRCGDAGTPVFVKQLGANAIDRNDAGFDGDDGRGWPSELAEEDRVEHLEEGYQGAPVRIHLRDLAGEDPNEWPKDLRVRQFPEAR
jgi:protein gp37